MCGMILLSEQRRQNNLKKTDQEKVREEKVGRREEKGKRGK